MSLSLQATKWQHWSCQYSEHHTYTSKMNTESTTQCLCHLSEILIHWVIDGLIDGVTGWLMIEWLWLITDWLIDRYPSLVDYQMIDNSWLVDLLIDRLVIDWLIDWFQPINQLTWYKNYSLTVLCDWLIDCCLIDWLSNNWLMDWLLIDGLIDWLLVDWLITCSLIDWLTRERELRTIDQFYSLDISIILNLNFKCNPADLAESLWR